jgi:HK97 family phage major capsid protein
MARKIAEIKNDLVEAKKALGAVDRSDKDALTAAVAKVEDLIRELDAANTEEAAEQALAERSFRTKEKKEKRKFSVLKFINEVATDSLSGLELDAAQEGAKEYDRLGFTRQGQVIPSFLLRDILGQSVTEDGDILGEVRPTVFMPQLNNKLTVQNLGATVLTGLVGKVPVASSAAVVAQWAAEGKDVEVRKINWAKNMLSPKRNVTRTAVTKDLLRQTSLDVESYLIRLMQNAHNELVEAGVIAGAVDGPTGILKTTGVKVIEAGGAITWDDIVALETAVNENNAGKGKLGYLTNAKVWGAMKTTPKVAGGERFIMEEAAGNRVNGYPADWTNIVPSADGSVMIFGNWEDLFVGEWGGFDIVIDPYTQAGSAQIIITINAWNDAIVAEPKSFAVLKGITA